MKLLLDEHFSPRIAQELRDRGHDAVAVGERSALRSIADRALFERAVAEQRALLTNDVGDFVPLLRDWIASGRDHYGLLLTSDTSMPRTRGAAGRFVEVLDELTAESAADDALLNQVLWPGP